MIAAVCLLLFLSVLSSFAGPIFFENSIEDDVNFDYTDYELYWDWQIIFPGTKWCGDGDIASDYDDLGYFKDTDMCCRTHDHCDDVIPSGENKYGLTNDGKYSRLHCKCDVDFFNCLKSLEQPIPTIIGTTYFNILGGQCFEEDYPIVRCLKWSSIIGQRKRCIEYEFDETKPKQWQWFDVPRFITLGRKNMNETLK